MVAPAWRGQGLGTYLVKHLIDRATQLLYLECLSKRLVEFYTCFGFVPVGWQELPRSLKIKFSLSALATTWFRFPVTIMQHTTE